jgi:RNA polymerase sigma factor (sigma-70 family)
MKPQRGNTAWDLLVGSLPMLRAYVRRLTGDGEQANDILQEVSVRLLATEGPGDPERYGAWARGMVRHVVAQDWRMRRRARVEQPLEEDLVEASFELQTHPEAHLDARAWVGRLADDLDSEGLQLLYRRYVLQESGKELADDHASSPEAMRMRLMRLRSSVSALVRSTGETLAFALATLATAAADFPLLTFDFPL